jgi:hypothetical protein
MSPTVQPGWARRASAHEGKVVPEHGVGQQRAEGRRTPVAVRRPLDQQVPAVLPQRHLVGLEQNQSQGDLIDRQRSLQPGGRLKMPPGGCQAQFPPGDFTLDALRVG